MGKIRRIVKLHGLGVHRDTFGLSGTSAYDDMTLFVGSHSSDYPISEDGIKYTGYVLDCLVDMPTVSSDSVDIFSPATSFGSCEFSIQIDKRFNVASFTSTYRYQYLGEKIGAFLNAGRVTPWGLYETSASVGQLDVDSWAEHTATGDFVYVAKRPWKPDLLEGDVIWWGREALLVTEYDSFAKGTITEYPNANAAFKAIKRAFGTRHERHGSKMSGEEDLEIYHDNPIKLSREVTVYDYDEDNDTLHFVWSGYMSSPKNSTNQHIVNISCNGLVGLLNRMKPFQYRALWSPSGNDEGVGGYSPHKRYLELKQLQDLNFIVCSQGDAIITAKYNKTATEPDGRKVYSIEPYGAIMNTSFIRDKEKTAKDLGPIKEILVGHTFWSHFFFDFGSGPEYSTHPFDVVRAFWHSDLGLEDNIYDVLPRGCGLAIPYDMVDHDEIDALKAGTYGGPTWVYQNLSMKSLVIGEGDDEDIWALCTRLLAPLMCIIIVNASGKLTIRTMLDRGPDYVVASYTDDDDTLKDGLEYENTGYDPVREVRYNIARRGISTNYSGEIRSSDLRKAQEKRFAGLAIDEEISAIDYGDTGIVPTNWMAVPETRALMALCATRYDIRNSGVHYYRFMVGQNLDPVSPGDLINLTHRIPFNNEGERGFTDQRMLVLEHDRLSPSEGGYSRYRVMDVGSLNARGGVIAPAWKVLSGTTTTMVIDTSETPWPELVRVGMVVTLMTNNHAQRFPGVDKTITNFDSGTNTITFSSAWSSAPQNTNYLILSDWTLADPVDQAVYAWVADTDAVLGSSDEGFTWGI